MRPSSPLDSHGSTPSELADRLAKERRGSPFLVLRDGDDAQRLVDLEQAPPRLTIGRSAHCTVTLEWDRKVSRIHAALERVGDDWIVVDDGLSTNGTLVAGERVIGRRRLAHRDHVQIGDTVLAYLAPAQGRGETTRMEDHRAEAVRVTEAQRRVLIALCRPFKDGATDAIPATNPRIAAELVLTVPAIKTHLRALFRTFGLDDLAQSEKRRRLVTAAFLSGVVRDRDL